ncbi:hypothetical protein ACH427_21415 [Streptomyces sp. NPDC020379]|uniref:hypothetical protein n=1 Tax=Streptomyces sp. NPDC020379 TaxID=3365071 RepID=UPI0037922424
MESPSSREAAWQIAFSLNQLAAAHVYGEVPTIPGEHESLIAGDLDDAWQSFFAHASPLPEPLRRQVRTLLEGWDMNPRRLMELLPVLDELASLHGADLPGITLPEP